MKTHKVFSFATIKLCYNVLEKNIDEVKKSEGRT